LPDDYRVAIEMIAAGEVDAKDFVTATYPLDDAAAAFAAASAGEQVKVLVTASPAP
jgi:L-iditol 2-dehydrogenase